MNFPNFLKSPLLNAVDGVMACIPRPKPTPEKFAAAKIVAHRGFCDNGAKENTLDAFRAAVACGAWGLEFDVRWTSDGFPVVHHDRSTQRVFGVDEKISALTFTECRDKFKEIPTLAELVQEFGAKTHLMIEIKQPLNGNPGRIEILQEILKSIEPGRDYHLMSLRVDDLVSCQFVPRTACLPIAEFNIETMSRAAVEHGFAGVTGQYVVVTDKHILRHHDVGQKIGTGFAASRSVLYRELNRGIDWVFTNETRLVAELMKG